MHRRRPGGHAHRVCLPVTTAMLGLALVAGCSSGSGAAPTSNPPATSQQPVSTPPTTASQTPVGLPIAPSPTPIDRKITRPPGAPPIDAHTCDVGIDAMEPFLKQVFFTAPTLSLQLIQLRGAGRLAATERRRVEKARRVWLRDGYPPSFPVVRDLDTYIDIYNKIIAAAKARNLNPLPDLYLRLQKVEAQYGVDADRSVCPQ